MKSSRVLFNTLRYGTYRQSARKVWNRLVVSSSPAKMDAIQWAEEHACDLEGVMNGLDPRLASEATLWAAALGVEARRALGRVPENMGGGGVYPMMFFLTRFRRPAVVVETGVAAGWVSRAVLEAMDLNSTGHLFSSDLPYLSSRNPKQNIGMLVPEQFRSRWTLDMRGDRKALPHLLGDVDRVDLFHYDSDKSYAGRRFAWDQLRPHLKAGSIIVMDDIQDNLFFAELVDREKLSFKVLNFEGKFTGVAVVPESKDSTRTAFSDWDL